MRKAVVCIFAHPDDEAFGPAGTIHKFAKDYDVYLLCATKGEVGQQSFKSKRQLKDIRVDELKESARILGVKNVYFLGFKDGTLSNNLYHKLASKIEKHLLKIKPEIILTSNPNGGSGHIDHIVVSMVSSFVFQKLKFIKKIMYTANTIEATKKWEEYEYFIYRPPGVERSKVHEIHDVGDEWGAKIKAMKAHKSQKHDYERIIKNREGFPKEEYFMIWERE